MLSHGLIEILYQHKMELLKELIENIERSLKEELNSFEKRIEKKALAYSEEQRNEYFEYMSDDYWKYKDEHPQIARQSFFLQAYFSFEHLLNEICTYYMRKKDLPLKLTDIKGQGLERAKIYISKVIGVSEPFINPIWNQIQFYNTVRNVYVHNAGEFDETNKKHLVARDSLGYISVNTSYQFILEEKFCLEVIKTFLSFTEILSEELRKNWNTSSVEALTESKNH